MGKNPGPRAAPGAPLLLVRQKSFIASLLPGAPSHRIEAEGFFLPPPPPPFVSQLFGRFADGAVLRTPQNLSFALLGEVISYLRRDRVMH